MRERLVEHCSANFQDHESIISSSSSPETSERKPIYKTLSAPLEVQLELTAACNRSCLHCYNFWQKEKRLTNQVLSDREISFIVELLERNKVFHLTITGGEPLLFKEKVFRLIKETTDRGIKCSLNSNLYSVTPSDSQRLKDSGVGFVLTSLPSSDPQTHDLITQHQGSFKETLQGIETLLKAGVRVGANMVISRINQDQIYETGRFLKELGVDYFYATKASPPLGVKEFEKIRADRAALKDSLAILVSLSSELGMVTDILECYPLCLIGEVEKFEKFTRHKCRGGITSATISPSGELRPCSHSDQSYGNIFAESFKKVWSSMGEWRDGSLIPQTCLSCTHFRRCSGGCRMEAKYYGKINDMDPFASRPEDVVLPKLRRSEDDGFGETAQEKLKVAANFKKRKEEFGGILKGRGDYVFVNNSLWNLIENLETRGSFAIEDSISFGEEQEKEILLRVFHFLYQEGILVKVKEGGEKK